MEEPISEDVKGYDIWEPLPGAEFVEHESKVSEDVALDPISAIYGGQTFTSSKSPQKTEPEQDIIQAKYGKLAEPIDQVPRPRRTSAWFEKNTSQEQAPIAEVPADPAQDKFNDFFDHDSSDEDYEQAFEELDTQAEPPQQKKKRNLFRRKKDFAEAVEELEDELITVGFEKSASEEAPPSEQPIDEELIQVAGQRTSGLQVSIYDDVDEEDL